MGPTGTTHWQRGYFASDIFKWYSDALTYPDERHALEASKHDRKLTKRSKTRHASGNVRRVPSTDDAGQAEDLAEFQRLAETKMDKKANCKSLSKKNNKKQKEMDIKVVIRLKVPENKTKELATNLSSTEKSNSLNNFSNEDNKRRMSSPSSIHADTDTTNKNLGRGTKKRIEKRKIISDNDKKLKEIKRYYQKNVTLQSQKPQNCHKQKICPSIIRNAPIENVNLPKRDSTDLSEAVIYEKLIAHKGINCPESLKDQTVQTESIVDNNDNNNDAISGIANSTNHEEPEDNGIYCDHQISMLDNVREEHNSVKPVSSKVALLFNRLEANKIKSRSMSSFSSYNLNRLFDIEESMPISNSFYTNSVVHACDLKSRIIDKIRQLCKGRETCRRKRRSCCKHKKDSCSSKESSRSCTKRAKIITKKDPPLCSSRKDTCKKKSTPADCDERRITITCKRKEKVGRTCSERKKGKSSENCEEKTTAGKGEAASCGAEAKTDRFDRWDKVCGKADDSCEKPDKPKCEEPKSSDPCSEKKEKDCPDIKKIEPCQKKNCPPVFRAPSGCDKNNDKKCGAGNKSFFRLYSTYISGFYTTKEFLRRDLSIRRDLRYFFTYRLLPQQDNISKNTNSRVKHCENKAALFTSSILDTYGVLWDECL